jgi:hypothetical protein
MPRRSSPVTIDFYQGCATPGFDPAPGIDLIKQQLEGITRGDGDLHGLSGSPVSAIEQLADCSNPGSLALRFRRQACQLDNNSRRMLASQFLHVPKNLGAPTRITTLALTKFQFSSFSVTGLFSGNIITQRSWPPLSLKSARPAIETCAKCRRGRRCTDKRPEFATRPDGRNRGSNSYS